MHQAANQIARQSTGTHQSFDSSAALASYSHRVTATHTSDSSVLQLPCNLPTPASLDATCRQMMGLLNQVARRFARRLPAHVELAELVSAGSVGLVMAVRQHHTAPQPVLVRLAEQRIRGAILDHLRAADHLTRRQRAAVSAVAKVKRKLEQDGEQVSVDKVAAALGITTERAERIEHRLASVQLVSIDGNEQLSASTSRPEEDTIRRETREGVVKALKKLPRRLQTLLSLYYFEELTYKEIGRLLGISRSRISQLHTQAIDLLRGHLAAAQAE